MMSRSDYERVARVIKEARRVFRGRGKLADEILDQVSEDLSATFQTENDRFDPVIWGRRTRPERGW